MLDMSPLGWLSRKISTQTNKNLKRSILLSLNVASVVRLDARPTDNQEITGSTPTPLDQQHSFMEIDHEIFSMVILSLLLIQEGQLSVIGKRMYTILVNSLVDKACPVKMWLGNLTMLDMTPMD